MYRYYGIIRSFTGPGLASTTVTVYDDAAGTSAATLYDSVGGGIANPTTTNARGAIDVYSPLTQLWYKVTGDTVVQPLPRHAHGGGGQNIRDWGATGDGTTDDTAAFVAALAYIDGLESAAPMYSKPWLYVPYGSYKLTNVPLAAARNIRVVGDGQYATILLAADTDGILFDLGTWSATPASWYGGLSPGFSLELMSLVEATNDDAKVPGRTATAIRDNGCGSVTLKNVEVRGFKYGFLASYGSDFSTIRDSHFIYNDLAVNIGPRSQQTEIARTEFDGNGIGVQLEWPAHSALRDCYFIDQHTYDVKFDYTSPTEAGVTHTDVYETSSVLLDHCWYESGAGYYGAGALADPAGHIYVGGTTSTPNGITIRDSLVYSATNTTGGQMVAKGGGTIYHFVGIAAGTNILIDGVHCYNNRIDAYVAPLGGYTTATVMLKNCQHEWGSTVIPAYFSPKTASCHYVGEIRSHAAAAPTSGNWYVGDMVWNTGAAASGKVGWVCTGAGKAHQDATGDTHSNTTVDNVNHVYAFANGDTIQGTGIPAGTTVASGGGTATIILSQAATATANGVALYDAVFKAFGAIDV